MSMSWRKQTNEKAPCLECRKRRIRCQEPLPCQYCVKQGLAEACLQSSIVKGTRSLKASSIVLHEDLARMSLRERNLEEALAEVQSSISSEPHPLLVKDPQIRIASPVPGLQRAMKIGCDDQRQGTDARADELVASMGMMSLNSKVYHGETATSEYLIKNDEEGPEAPTNLPAIRHPPPSGLPPELILLSVQFPLPPSDQRPLDMDVFLEFLPPYERTIRLFNMYHSYFTWCTMVSPFSDTLENVLVPLYPDGTVIDSLEPTDAPRLAVLFMICLLGTLYDLNLNMENVLSHTEVFHTLARAAMASYTVTEHPTLQGIQAMLLMIWYFRLFPGRRSPGYQWLLAGVLSKVVQSIGLHRDASGSIPDPNQRAPYEQTFWEYHCNDIWQSFMFGRPTSMVTHMIDCKRPTQVNVPQGQNPEFFPWKYSFTQLVCEVVAQTLHTSNYSDIIKIETKLKAHYIPLSLTWPPHGAPLPDEPIGRVFQRYIAAVWRNVSVMYLHRRFLVEVLRKYKDDDPTTSPHWRSAHVAYDNARALVHDMRRIWLNYSPFVERMAPFWSHTLSAALLLGSLVAFIPSSPFAADALQHLDETCDMFVDARESLQPPNCLSALRKCQRQARYAFNKLHDPLGTKNIKEEADASLSPSEAQFPFTFGEAHPQVPHMANQYMYGLVPMGEVVRPSTASEDGSSVYRSTSVPLGSTGCPPSSSVHQMKRKVNGHDGQQQAWGQLISQMTTHL